MKSRLLALTVKMSVRTSRRLSVTNYMYVRVYMIVFTKLGKPVEFDVFFCRIICIEFVAYVIKYILPVKLVKAAFFFFPSAIKSVTFVIAAKTFC